MDIVAKECVSTSEERFLYIIKTRPILFLLQLQET